MMDIFTTIGFTTYVEIIWECVAWINLAQDRVQ